jgi:hypothetical protein
MIRGANTMLFDQGAAATDDIAWPGAEPASAQRVPGRREPNRHCVGASQNESEDEG